MARALVSVVIPTYQRRELALRAARSVLAQRYEPLELLVVDDGSTDGTVEALGTIDDPRLAVLGVEHGGVSVARNAALERARGTIVAFLDSDDRWLPHHLATVTGMLDRWPAAVLATTTADFASFGWRPARAARLVHPLPRLLAETLSGGSPPLPSAPRRSRRAASSRRISTTARTRTCIAGSLSSARSRRCGRAP